MAAQDRLEKIAALTGLGTVTAFAEVAGVKPGTAQKHKDRDSIPRKRALQYVAAARKYGVLVSFEWLQTGKGPEPKELPYNSLTRTVPKLPADDPTTSAEKDSALRLPLWQISDLRREANATVQILAESTDKVLGIDALRDLHSAFAVRMWDSSNGPYLPRGTILYVERPYGGSPSELCLFAQSHNHTELIGPVVGVLIREENGQWIVRQDTTTVELPQVNYPICWRIKNTRRD